MGEIIGIAASSGKAAGKVFWIRQETGSLINPDENLRQDEQVARFRDAYIIVRDRLSSHAQNNEIFAAHLEILEDLAERIIARIEQERVDAVHGVENTCTEVCALFSDIEDEYLRARSDDIVDVCRQIVSVLLGNLDNPFSAMSSGSIILADNLLPSDTMLIDLSKLEGIALKKGSVNSHLAILSKNNGIPLVLGIGDVLDNVADGDIVVVDGENGRIITQPEELLLSEIERLRSDQEKTDAEPAITKDGAGIIVLANAGGLFDVERAIYRGADGIGLLRTEFIFMQGTRFPDEDEQYSIYSECARLCHGKIMTIRTLDIGADKQLPYYMMDTEENPALGLRGIRFSLAHPDIFKIQLRAVLRASTLGNIRLMFPMITSVEEYDRALELLGVCKKELKAERKIFDDTLRPGIMIETPAAVLLADDLAQKVPFFSIGTNDLTQYVLVVDRENPYPGGACDPLHPAVVRSMAHVVEAAQRWGADVSVCGELASDTEATGLLLKLGIRKLSVTSRSIPMLKEHIRKQTLNL